MAIPFNSCFVTRLKTLETYSQDIITCSLDLNTQTFLMKPNIFLANRVLPLLLK